MPLTAVTDISIVANLNNDFNIVIVNHIFSWSSVLDFDEITKISYGELNISSVLKHLLVFYLAKLCPYKWYHIYSSTRWGFFHYKFHA